MSDLDVIIAGGGPAGSTAAALLARAGRSVRLYDRERFPRFHVGESLLPHSEPLLRRLGVWDQLAAAGFQRKWGAHFTFEPDGGSNHISFARALGRKPPAQAFQVRRAAKHPDEEAIHDLRVSIRRLSRCLRLFSPLYPGSSWKKVRNRLKVLMEAAGEVRDRDIAAKLLIDALVSTFRQWALRPECWYALPAESPQTLAEGIPTFYTIRPFRPRRAAMVHGTIRAG